MRSIIGYDGCAIHKGDRVELSPACDLWMMGARYGTVTFVGNLRAHVVLDKVDDKVLTVTGDLLRRVEGERG